MPKWGIHRKYALRFIREKYSVQRDHSYWDNLVNDINLLIDFPDKYFSEKDYAWIKSRIRSNKQRQCMEVAYLISLIHMGFKVIGVVHDWRTIRNNRSPLVKQVAYCIYGEIGAKLVDLHSALDRIKQKEYREYKDFIQWAIQNNIDKEILYFIKTYWEEIIKDILKEKYTVVKNHEHRSVQRDYF